MIISTQCRNVCG